MPFHVRSNGDIEVIALVTQLLVQQSHRYLNKYLNSGGKEEPTQEIINHKIEYSKSK